MRYRITKFQMFVLDWVARKIVIQSHEHKRNIVQYYKIVADAARDQFREDNRYTLNDFLDECFKESLGR